MAQEHSHDHAYLHEHNIPHLHHETDVHDAEHNHEHAHSHDHAEGHGHVHENTQAVLNRLSRAIGHLESVRKMVENGRDCSEVLIQIAAVRAAITNIGKVILQDHIQHCIVDAVEHDDEQALDALCQAIDKFVK
jgi:DNA-binding FrmR family transcriptional regulator